MVIRMKAKRFALTVAMVGTALFYFSCGANKNISATSLEDGSDDQVGSSSVTNEGLTQFVMAAAEIRKNLDSSDKEQIEQALRNLGRDIRNQDSAAFTSFIGAVTQNAKVASATKLIETNLKAIAAATEDDSKTVGAGPLVIPGVRKADGKALLVLDDVKAPNNNMKFALWESVLSTNPFDLLALAQDSGAQLIHVEQYIPALVDAVNAAPDGQRVGVVGKTSFITLSAADDSASFMREARGVCSDLERVNGNGAKMETKRTFEFITPTLANAARPSLGEDRSPRIGEVQPNMSSTSFLNMVRQGCLKQSNASGPTRAVKLSYEVVAAFRVTGLGTFRILAADLRFGTAGNTSVTDVPPARLYWLQRAISNIPAAK